MRRMITAASLASIVAVRMLPAAAEPLPADTGIKWDPSPQQVAQSCQQRIEQARSGIRGVDGKGAEVGFADGLGAIEAIEADLSDALVAESVLAQISVRKDVRDASARCEEELSKFANETGADPTLFAIATAAQAHAATDADRALAEHYVEAGRRAGAGLPAARRKQVTALFDRLSKLEIGFEQTLSEDRSRITISRAEAESLPPGFVATLKAAGNGYVVPVNESTTEQFLRNERSSAARRRFQFTYYQRGGPANVQRLVEAIAIRDRLAHLLGFGSWAAYRLDATMAKTPARVMALLDKVDTALLPKARDELAVLEQMKRDAGDPTPFQRSDAFYFEDKLQKARYAVDAEAVRRYFPLEKVIASVFEIYEHLLGVRFDPISPAAAWAPDVREYSVSDAASGQPIGWFFLDLFPRDGKYNHFAMFPLRAGRLLADGTRQRPIGAIIGNWPVAAPGKPALLSHDDVITFFHEFGHLMHQSLSLAPYETLWGTSLRHDFVEAPSQMLENWMWQPTILKRVSSEVDTGQPLPDDLIAKMIAARHINDGLRWTRQAFYASYDMALSDSGSHVQPTPLWFALSRKLTALPDTVGTIPEAGFGHLMGGYDAGYYGYLWSLVYAQDMFSVFEQGGLDSAEVGMRYRHDILEPGAIAEPEVLVQRFLGRDLSYEPFYRRVGVAGK